MSARPSGDAPAPAPATDQVQVRTGHLSDVELAAVTVALAAINTASHAEAEDRALRSGQGHAQTAWSDPIYLVRGGHRLRGFPSDHAWVTSHR